MSWRALPGSDIYEITRGGVLREIRARRGNGTFIERRVWPVQIEGQVLYALNLDGCKKIYSADELVAATYDGVTGRWDVESVRAHEAKRAHERPLAVERALNKAKRRVAKRDYAARASVRQRAIAARVLRNATGVPMSADEVAERTGIPEHVIRFVARRMALATQPSEQQPSAHQKETT